MPFLYCHFILAFSEGDTNFVLCSELFSFFSKIFMPVYTRCLTLCTYNKIDYVDSYILLMKKRFRSCTFSCLCVHSKNICQRLLWGLPFSEDDVPQQKYDWSYISSYGITFFSLFSFPVYQLPCSSCWFAELVEP